MGPISGPKNRAANSSLRSKLRTNVKAQKLKQPEIRLQNWILLAAPFLGSPSLQHFGKKSGDGKAAIKQSSTMGFFIPAPVALEAQDSTKVSETSPSSDDSTEPAQALLMLRVVMFGEMSSQPSPQLPATFERIGALGGQKEFLILGSGPWTGQLKLGIFQDWMDAES